MENFVVLTPMICVSDFGHVSGVVYYCESIEKVLDGDLKEYFEFLCALFTQDVEYGVEEVFEFEIISLETKEKRTFKYIFHKDEYKVVEVKKTTTTIYRVEHYTDGMTCIDDINESISFANYEKAKEKFEIEKEDVKKSFEKFEEQENMIKYYFKDNGNVCIGIVRLVEVEVNND